MTTPEQHTAQNKALAQRWFNEVWNQGSASAIDELFHPEGLCHDFPAAGQSITRAEFKAVHQTFLNSFSDIRLTVNDLVAEGDKVGVRWSATMKHTGDALGPKATGREVTLVGGGILHFRDGQILHGWNLIDQLHFQQQLQ